MKKNLILTITMVLSLFFFSSFSPAIKKETSAKSRVSSVKLKAKKFALETGSYDAGGGIVALFFADDDGNVWTKVSINGTVDDSVFSTGELSYFDGNFTTSGLTLFYFGSSSGSITVPDGTYAATSSF